MSTQRNSIIPAAFLLLRREDEILLQRRFHTGFQDGQYTFISGHVDAGEPPVLAICREAKEEAGIIVLPKDVRFEQVLYRRSFKTHGGGYDLTAPERIDFFFSTNKWEGEPHITEPDKCDDLRWFPMNRLPENMLSNARAFLLEHEHQFYKESGYENE